MSQVSLPLWGTDSHSPASNTVYPIRMYYRYTVDIICNNTFPIQKQIMFVLVGCITWGRCQTIVVREGCDPLCYIHYPKFRLRHGLRNHSTRGETGCFYELFTDGITSCTKRPNSACARLVTSAGSGSPSACCRAVTVAKRLVGSPSKHC